MNGAAPASWYDDVYSKASPAYACHYTASPYYFVWTVIAERVRAARAVIEVGCGPGQLAHLLHDQGLARYLGFDFSQAAVAMARARVPAWDFRVDDARTTRLYAEFEHDTIVCTEVLEHIDEDVRTLEHMRPGVRVIATVPNFDSASHVRHFSDADSVLQRYGQLFRSPAVHTLAFTEQRRFFLLDGVRCE